MNRLILRFTWLAVKAAEWILPVLWRICLIALYFALCALVALVIAIIVIIL